MEEKRRFSRVTAPFDVNLTDGSGATSKTRLQDIAIQGAFVQCTPDIALGTEVDVDIVLHGGIDDVHILSKGEVVHREDAGLGIRFTAIDPECVGHLRNLITYNAEDADRVLDEIYEGGANPPAG